MLASLLFGAFYALSIRVGSLEIPPQLPQMIQLQAGIPREQIVLLYEGEQVPAA